MNYSVQDIISFMELCGYKCSNLEEGTSLVRDLGIWGDELEGLLVEYAEKFEVDMSSYLWYFHTKEEGYSIGGLFFQPPNERVDRIPITIDLLVKSANEGKWLVTYPEHEIPEHRPDIFINQLFCGALLVAVLLFLCAKGCT